MRFLSIYKHAERDEQPTQDEMERMGRLIEEKLATGELVATEGCLPTRFGARVRLAGDTLSVTDGPFSEAKEVVGGFAILNATSKEDAIRQAREFLAVVGEGECELRQIYEVPTPCAPEEVAARLPGVEAAAR